MRRMVSGFSLAAMLIGPVGSQIAHFNLEMVPQKEPSFEFENAEFSDGAMTLRADRMIVKGATWTLHGHVTVTVR
jgi:hypothetical protein